jgi:hypothetical protein
MGLPGCPQTRAVARRRLVAAAQSGYDLLHVSSKAEAEPPLMIVTDLLIGCAHAAAFGISIGRRVTVADFLARSRVSCRRDPRLLVDFHASDGESNRICPDEYQVDGIRVRTATVLTTSSWGRLACYARSGE